MTSVFDSVSIDSFVRGVGIDHRVSVKAASDAAAALATYVDGSTLDTTVTINTGDRILLKDQTDPTQNGIYTVDGANPPIRAPDFRSGDSAVGKEVYVREGTANIGTEWRVYSGATVGSAMVFHQSSELNLIAGDMTYTSADGTAIVALADVATGNVLISGGVATAPLYGKVGLTTHVSGLLPIANGGTALSTTPTAGQLFIGNTTNSDYDLAVITGTANQVTVLNGDGSITLSLAALIDVDTSGNAATATAFQTARDINGVSFDGTANITVTAAAGTLTGTTLNATVVTSSLTEVGTIGTGTWNGATVGPTYGGTGFSSYTTGDVLYADSSTTLAKLGSPSVISVLQNDISGTVVWKDLADIQTGINVHEGSSIGTESNISTDDSTAVTASAAAGTLTTSTDPVNWVPGTILSGTGVPSGTYIVSGTHPTFIISFTSAIGSTSVTGVSGYHTSIRATGSTVSGTTALTTTTLPIWIVGQRLMETTPNTNFPVDTVIVSGAGNAWVMSGAALATGAVTGLEGGTGYYTNIDPSDNVGFNLEEASFSGTIAINVLTVAAPFNGKIHVGQLILGAGVTNSPVVSSLGTGTGGEGTYNLSNSPADIGPVAMTARHVLTTGERVLVKNQTDLKQNGIYVVQPPITGTVSTSMQRSLDADGTPSAEISGGDFTFISCGLNLANTGWILQGDGNQVPNTNDMVWVQFNAAGNIAAGDGILVSGNVVSTRNNVNGGISNSSGLNLLNFTAGDNTAIIGDLPVLAGGTGQSTLTAGGILTGNDAGVILQSAVGVSGDMLLSRAAAAPVWLETPTYSTLGVGAGGDPAWSTSVHAAAIIAPTSGGEIVTSFTGVASSVNNLIVTNAITAENPQIEAGGSGSDANLGLDFLVKGTGTYNFQATASNAASFHLHETSNLNFSTLRGAAVLADDTTVFELPANNGTSGFHLVTNGSGVTSWADHGVTLAPNAVSLVPQKIEVTSTTYTTIAYYSYNPLDTPNAEAAGAAKLTYNTVATGTTLEIEVFLLSAAGAPTATSRGASTGISTAVGGETDLTPIATSEGWVVQARVAGAGQVDIYGLGLAFNT
jgi:hypothetical protein